MRHSSSQPLYSYESLPANSLRIFKGDTELGVVELAVPGEHNKQNAVAAIATGTELGLAFPVLAQSIACFKGVDRRFQKIGTVDGTEVIDDYAHHPTEVRAVLQAGRDYLNQLQKSDGIKRRLVAIFQPHQPGRLRDFWDDFCTSFKDADLVLITDIYIARGANIDKIDSKRFVNCLDHGHASHLPGSVNEILPLVLKHVRPFDVILTIGAGDITKLGPLLLAELNKTANHGSSS
jgi:UDP-N-acetylmuramate--alanine ligase